MCIIVLSKLAGPYPDVSCFFKSDTSRSIPLVTYIELVS